MTQKRIMVVEDENIIALDIKNRLICFGYDVPAVVPSGEEAIVKADELKPDLILMDIGLRGRLDGVEAAEVILKHCKVPLIYLTSYSDESTMKRTRKFEKVGIIIKPFNEQELRRKIEEALLGK